MISRAQERNGENIKETETKALETRARDPGEYTMEVRDGGKKRKDRSGQRKV